MMMMMTMMFEMKGATIMTCLWLLLSVLIGFANGTYDRWWSSFDFVQLSIFSDESHDRLHES